MKKLNRNFLSFFEFFGLKKANPDQPRGYSWFGFRYFDGSDDDPIVLLRKGRIILDKIYPRFQFMGAFTPLAKMKKDLFETFKPYHSNGKLYRDLLQPFRGFGNLVKGALGVVGGVLITSLMMIGMIGLFWLPAYRYRIVYPMSWVIEGVSNIIRGITQMATAPLTYLFRLPLRGFLTALFGTKPVEEKSEIKRLADELKQLTKTVNSNDTIVKEPLLREKKHNKKMGRQIASLLFEIERKYEKSIKDGWKSQNDSDEVRMKFKGIYPFFKRVAEGTVQKKVDQEYEKDSPQVKAWQSQFNNGLLGARETGNKVRLTGLVNESAPWITQEQINEVCEYVSYFTNKC